MRDARRLQMTPAQWADARARAQERALVELLRILERARLERPEWYVWVTEEWPRIKAGRK
jgi:hypothetical protein